MKTQKYIGLPPINTYTQKQAHKPNFNFPEWFFPFISKPLRTQLSRCINANWKNVVEIPGRGGIVNLPTEAHDISIPTVKITK